MQDYYNVKLSQPPKYTLLINFKHKIAWKTDSEDRQLKALGFTCNEKHKWFFSSDENLQHVKRLLSNRVFFGNISSFFKSHEIVGSGASCKVIVIERYNGQGKFVAKCISKEYITKKKTSERFDRLENEIKVLKELDNGYIVKLLDVFEGESSYYLVFEYLEGDTLYRYIKNYKFIPEDVIRNIMFQLLSGIKYLHDLKIIHRDIKLENIMFKEDLKLKIIDFGLAIYLYRNNPFAICGTPGYIAPEILQFEDQMKKSTFQYTDRIDMFGIGILLYRMITRTSLFESEKTRDLIILNKKCHIPRVHHSLYSKQLNTLLYGLLEPNPQMRLSAEESLSELGYIKINQIDDMTRTKTKTYHKQQSDEFEVEFTVEHIQKPYTSQSCPSKKEIYHSYHQNEDYHLHLKSYCPSFSICPSLEGSEFLEKNNNDFVIEK